MLDISSNIENILYLISASMFILGIKRLASPATARNGNRLSSVAMLIAIVVTILKYTETNFEWIILGLIIGSSIGILLSRYVQMTAMPQLVAIFNAFGGAASAIVAMYELMFQSGSSQTIFVLASVCFATIIGSVTFTGSFIAFGKLQEVLTTKPILIPLRNFILFPLEEIFSTWKHPKTGEIICSLIQKLPNEDKKSILKIKNN